MGDKELNNRARNDKSAKESELSFTNPVNRVAPSLFIESMIYGLILLMEQLKMFVCWWRCDE